VSGIEDNVVANRPGARSQRCRRRHGLRTGVDADLTEIVAEARLHLSANRSIERLSFLAVQHGPNDGRHAARGEQFD
jgi:hypothetical protein